MNYIANYYLNPFNIGKPLKSLKAGIWIKIQIKRNFIT